MSSSYHGLTLLSIVSLVHTRNTCWNQFFLRLHCSAKGMCGFLDHPALSKHLVNHHIRQNPLVSLHPADLSLCWPWGGHLSLLPCQLQQTSSISHGYVSPAFFADSEPCHAPGSRKQCTHRLHDSMSGPTKSFCQSAVHGLSHEVLVHPVGLSTMLPFPSPGWLPHLCQVSFNYSLF